MSQAEALLNRAELTGMYTASPETEPHIVIGADRVITVPDDLKRLGVQFDHNIETVVFDCPRYWDDTDMSTMKVYINYERKDRAKGLYEVETVTVDDNDQSMMHFDWTISNNVTLVAGDLKFNVCIKSADEDGRLIEHWNSELCDDCYISEGLENGEAIAQSYPDVLAKWDAENKAAVKKVVDELMETKNAGVFDGATFTPHVSEECDVSWSNDQDLPNPQPVNIKGDPGFSPTVEASAIDTGYHVKITDIKGITELDILHGKTDTASTVEFMKTYINIGTTEPTTSPAIWFDNTDIEDGNSGVLKYKDADGAVHIMKPVTDKSNVNGMEDVDNHIADKNNPHNVTAEQIGLNTDALNEALDNSDNHIADKNNPHNVTAEQIGLNLLSGNSDPTEATVGRIGQSYFNQEAESFFKCVAHVSNGGSTTYVWVPLGSGNKASFGTRGPILFTESGMFNIDDYGLRIGDSVNVIVIGGGGGGGYGVSAPTTLAAGGYGSGGNGTNGGSNASSGYKSGGGGGGSGYVKSATVMLTEATVNITIGAAGSAGSDGKNGGAGGTTSFGAYLSASGGGGGTSSASSYSSNPAECPGGAGGNSGGTGQGKGTLINLTGGSGGAGFTITGTFMYGSDSAVVGVGSGAVFIWY